MTQGQFQQSYPSQVPSYGNQGYPQASNQYPDQSVYGQQDFQQYAQQYGQTGYYGQPGQTGEDSQPVQQGWYDQSGQYVPSGQFVPQYQQYGYGQQNLGQYGPYAQDYANQYAGQPFVQSQIPVAVPTPAGAVNPVTQSSAYQQADKQYGKAARRGGFWRIVFLIALVVLVGSLSAVGYILYTYWHGQAEYDELTQYMTVEETDGATTLGSFNVDWDALRAINSDIVGWVYVPGTPINYPIAWRKDDDKYYLKHNFGDNSAGDFGAEYGCIMLSGVNNRDWHDQVNIIYGHNMRNGSMFAALGENMNTDKFNEHRTVYLLTPKGNYRLTSFAVNKVKGSSTDIVIPNFDTEEEFHAYVQARIDNSPVTPSPPIPPADDIKQVFALSTCNEPDNSYRIITFCYPEEFLPIGSDTMDGDALIDENDVSSVEEQMNSRLS